MSDKKEIASGQLVLDKKIFQVGSLIANGDRDTDELAKALQAVIDNKPFRVELLNPKTLADFLALKNPSQGIWNQVVSELGDNWPDFLNDIEARCFLNPENLAKVKPYLGALWANEKSSSEPLKPPVNWQYLPVPEAIEVYKKIFDSSLNGSSTVERAKNLMPWEHSEGTGVWLKLSVLARFFCNNSDDPLADDEKGRLAYQKVLQTLVSEKNGILKREYQKAFPEFGFKNWREDEMDKFFLTPAGRATWVKLESQSDDDFVIAPVNSGSLYSGCSVRNARIKIVESGNQEPQDAVMNSLTLAIQPERLSANEHLCVDCSGTMFKASDHFSHASRLYFSDGRLHFDAGWLDYADYFFGSSSLCLR